MDSIRTHRDKSTSRRTTFIVLVILCVISDRLSSANTTELSPTLVVINTFSDYSADITVIESPSVSVRSAPITSEVTTTVLLTSDIPSSSGINTSSRLSSAKGTTPSTLIENTSVLLSSSSGISLTEIESVLRTIPWPTSSIILEGSVVSTVPELDTSQIPESTVIKEAPLSTQESPSDDVSASSSQFSVESNSNASSYAVSITSFLPTNTLITSAAFVNGEMDISTISSLRTYVTPNYSVYSIDLKSLSLSESFSSTSIPSTAGIFLSITSTSAMSEFTQVNPSRSFASPEFSSDLSSAMRPTTSYEGSSVYSENLSVTDIVLPSSRSYGDSPTLSVITPTLPFTMSTTASPMMTTNDTSLSSAAFSKVSEATSTLISSTTADHTATPTSTTPSSSDLTSSSDSLLTTALLQTSTQHPVTTSTTQHATSTPELLESSEIIYSEHVTSTLFHPSSVDDILPSSSIDTSSIDMRVSSSTMPVTPDASLLAELDKLRGQVKDLEDSNDGLQAATIVLVVLLVLVLVAIGVLMFRRSVNTQDIIKSPNRKTKTRNKDIPTKNGTNIMNLHKNRRRMNKRKKNRFGGIDADLSSPVIQRPKPKFGYDDSQAMMFGGRVSTATLEETDEMSSLGTFVTSKPGVHNNNMDTPS